MSFDITFLGASGGPIEASTCSLLIKPHHFDYEQIKSAQESPLLQVDAGSGHLSLAELIADASSASRLLSLYEDANDLQEYLSLEPTNPFANVQGSPFSASKRILNCIPTILITHPHLDHIAALVLNSAERNFRDAQATVYGSLFTTQTLQSHVFNGKIWPNMVELGALMLAPVQANMPFTTNNGIYSITMFDLQHGNTYTDGHPVPYMSSAYLIQHNASRSKLLVFGDFEADVVSGKGLNRHIWEQIAPYVADGSLKASVVECSMCSQESCDELYGHLMPEHLIGELEVLRSYCRMKPTLKEFHVIVTHVKETPGGPDPRQKILKELGELASRSNLQVSFSMALSGISFTI
ncbi:hypothetical protein CJJ07_003072 [Candidozyma auris]|nr:hypothetical protein CJJ07_003072 [[Candida] auris]